MWLSKGLVELVSDFGVVDGKTLLLLISIDCYVFAGNSYYFATGMFQYVPTLFQFSVLVAW